MGPLATIQLLHMWNEEDDCVRKLLPGLAVLAAGWVGMVQVAETPRRTIDTLFLQPNRTYYLMDPSGNAHKWCRKIQEVWRQRYQSHPDAAVQ